MFFQKNSFQKNFFEQKFFSKKKIFIKNLFKKIFFRKFFSKIFFWKKKFIKKISTSKDFPIYRKRKSRLLTVEQIRSLKIFSKWLVLWGTWNSLSLFRSSDSDNDQDSGDLVAKVAARLKTKVVAAAVLMSKSNKVKKCEQNLLPKLLISIERFPVSTKWVLL